MQLHSYWLLGLGLAMVAPPALAFIERMYSFQEVLAESTHILAGRLDQVDERARTAVMTVERAAKGSADYQRVNFNIALGPSHHGRYMVDRISAGLPAILYYKKDGQNIASLLHTGDNWYQFYATDEPVNRDKLWWRFTHVEIKMGRTYLGATTNLIKLTDEVLAKRVEPPKPDPQVPDVDVNRPAFLAVPANANQTNGFFRQRHLRANAEGDVRGVSLADVNGDGFLDVYLCRQNGNLLLFNQGGSFTEMAREMGVAAGSRAAAWADFNGDGQPDLLGADGQVYRHVGDKLKAEADLLPGPVRRGLEGAGWMDYDGDGWPDILQAQGEDGLRLYHNPGNGKDRFPDVSLVRGLGPKGLGGGNGNYLAFFDFDGDGFTDFFYNLNEGVLAHNERGGTFTLCERSGLTLPGGPAYKRGLAIGDYDKDGNLDILVPGPDQPLLYHNNNNGTFSNVTAQAGDLAKIKRPTFSAAWGDVNGDGHLDLFLCLSQGPGVLLFNDGKGGFVEVSAQLGVNTLAPAFGAAFADMDNDGDLDLVVNLREKVVVAFNDVPKPPDRHALAISLRARKGATGAAVRVLDKDYRLLGLRELGGGAGGGGQDSPVACFSLPPGPCRVYAALSDGRWARKEVIVGAAKPRQLVTFEEAEFK